MAILKGIVASASITARRSVKEQIRGACQDFIKKVEQQATDNGLLDKVVPVAEIDQIHQIVKAIQSCELH